MLQVMGSQRVGLNSVMELSHSKADPSPTQVIRSSALFVKKGDGV